MTTTVAQAHRQLVAEMDGEGDSPAEIAKKLGISVDRVEAILDQLDESDGRPAHPDDEHRGPAVEPVRPDPRPLEQSGPIVVGSPARAPSKPKPVAVRSVPEHPLEEAAHHASPPVVSHPDEGVDRMALTTDIEWAEPPAPARRGVGLDQNITAVIEQLKRNPGRWAAVVKGQRTSSGATTWKKRGCEAVSRREESVAGAPARWTVYARWPA